MSLTEQSSRAGNRLLNPARFAPFAGQTGDDRAQHAATTPEPIPRDRDN